MFEGVQEQFHQFFAPPPPPPPQQQTRAASPNNSIPLSFSLLHGNLHPPPPPSSSPFPIFDTYPPHPHPLQPPIHHHHHHHLHQQMLQYPPVAAVHSKSVKQEGQGENSNTSGFLSRGLVVERDRSSSVPMELDLGQPSWSPDEVLALFRVRSALEDWFPDFTWEHVSRKMEEIGFRRSPQKCKEKFEEESRYLHHTTTSSINADDISCPTKNNYRLFSELEELCQNDVVLDKQQNPQGEPQLQEQEQEDDHDGGGQGQDRIGQEALVDENDGSEATDHHHQQQQHHHMVTTIDEIDEVEKEKGMEKIRRGKGHDHRKKKFEIFKGFCEDIVSKMMAHQEELHNKILEDLIKRDEEKIAREEAWKKQEIERINKEMEARAKDQAIAGDRQAKIIEFLKKFTMNNSNDEANNAVTLQNPSSSATHSSLNYNYHIPTSSNDESLSQSQTSNSLTTHIDPIAPTSNSAEENKMQPISRKPKRSKRPCSTTSDPIYDDSGKRWPREEVLALINIRCNLDSSNNNAAGSDNTDQTDRNKNPPLWERISKSMMELGYKRSAKRCKEKWENINKYFRKTKDSKKKRTVDSRTCPYFHQLSHLYNHGRISGGNHGSGGGGDDANVNLSDHQGEPNGAHVTTSA